MDLFDITWNRSLGNRSFPKHKASKPSLKIALKHIGFGIRHLIYTLQERYNRKAPALEIFARSIGPYAGVPIGGIGSGSVNRGWRGEFARWQLSPSGVRDWDVIDIDGFSLRVVDTSNSKDIHTSFLHPQKPSMCSPMHSWYKYPWDWDNAVYHALFPQAWTVYDLNPKDQVVVTCHQFSPVISNNYIESTYPISMFIYKLENTSENKIYEVSLMFTFANSVGNHNNSHNCENNFFNYKNIMGIRMYHEIKRTLRKENGKNQEFSDPVTLAIALETNNSTSISSYCEKFDSMDKKHCERLFKNFSETGKVRNLKSKKEYGQLSTAISVTVKIKPGEIIEIPFCLAWNIPIVRFGTGKCFQRKYVTFFDLDSLTIYNVIKTGFKDWKKWERAINENQKFITHNIHYDEWFKCSLLNELYYIVDGGTMWLLDYDGEEHFAYLEGLEYLMYNTYDVHFYSCFALLENWPYLNELIQNDISNGFFLEDNRRVQIIASGKKVPRKIKYTIPHDVGNPAENSFYRINAYRQQDTSKWKDLGPKFILQIYLHYLKVQDTGFLQRNWKIVKMLISSLLLYDKDNDGIIENEGIPDTTYDAWMAIGPSAYIGGLFLASLQAAIKIAHILEKDSFNWTEVLNKGLKSYRDKLWNGEYFLYDTSGNKTIMSDQLCGHFYSKFLGLGGIADNEIVHIALQTIYNNNFLKFKEGNVGVINGMYPNGKIDETSLQSSEVWVGTVFILAAAMIQGNLIKEAFEITLRTLYNSYEVFGYQFQTPEAWDKNGHFRSCAYMRPLSIWAIHSQMKLLF